MKMPIINHGQLPGRFGTAEDLYDALHTWAQGWYEEMPRHAEHPWRMVVVFNDGPAFVYGFNDEVITSKQHIFEMHRRSFEFGADVGNAALVRFAVLVCEAWKRALKKDEERLFDNLSEDPKSTEVLMFNLLSPDRQALMSCAIDRSGQKGAVIEKTPFQWLDANPELKVGGGAVRRPTDDTETSTSTGAPDA